MFHHYRGKNNVRCFHQEIFNSINENESNTIPQIYKNSKPMKPIDLDFFKVCNTIGIF